MVVRKLQPKKAISFIILNKELRKSRKLRQHRDLHGAFIEIIKQDLFLLPGLRDEYKFHSIRQFAFDFAWPQLKIGVDLQGGIYKPGRRTGHTSIKGMENDMEKLNLAVTNGWLVLLFSPNKVYQEQAYVLSSVRAVHRIRGKVQ